MLYTQTLNPDFKIEQKIPVYTAVEKYGSDVLIVAPRFYDIKQYLTIEAKEFLDVEEVGYSCLKHTPDRWLVCIYDIKDKYNNCKYIIQKF